MLALRDELRAEGGGPHSAVEYGTIFLSNLDDEGLVVFPTHRVVHGLERFDLDGVIERARDFFSVEERGQTMGGAEARAELAERGRRGPSFGLLSGERRFFLTLRSDVDLERVASLRGPAVLRKLDVTLLHALVI